jgi:hypothetical protein
MIEKDLNKRVERDSSAISLTSLRNLLRTGSDEEIKSALTDELIHRRLIYCPRISRDMLDDWGLFGCCPGFIYVVSRVHNSTDTLNEDMWQQAKTSKGIEVGQHFLQALPHWDSFPSTMFKYEIIRSENESEEYRKLISVLEITVM